MVRRFLDAVIVVITENLPEVKNFTIDSTVGSKRSKNFLQILQILQLCKVEMICWRQSSDSHAVASVPLRYSLKTITLLYSIEKAPSITPNSFSPDIKLL